MPMFKENWYSQDFRFMYNWKRLDIVKFYSGASLDTRTAIYRPDIEFWDITMWYEVTFLGLDIYPSNRVENLSICLEAKTLQFDNLYGTIAIFYKIR